MNRYEVWWPSAHVPLSMDRMVKDQNFLRIEYTSDGMILYAPDASGVVELVKRIAQLRDETVTVFTTSGWVMTYDRDGKDGS